MSPAHHTNLDDDDIVHHRLAASYAGAASRGGDRSFQHARHRHCCSLCSMQSHTERCDPECMMFQLQPIRAQISICMVTGCRRAAGRGHVHCCTFYVWHGGRQHTKQCTTRQVIASMRGLVVQMNRQFMLLLLLARMPRFPLPRPPPRTPML